MTTYTRVGLVVDVPGGTPQDSVLLDPSGHTITSDGVIIAAGEGGGPATQLDANGTTLDINVITDGEVLKRVGTTIVSAPAGAPGAHATSHQDAGSDEISVAGLSGVLADPQPPIIGATGTTAVAGNDARLTDARTPTTHASMHENAGAGEISVAGLSGVLADPQPPIIGAGGTQAVAGNDARLTDARTPTSHVVATNLALGAQHTISGAAAGQVLRATAATAANFQALVEGDITNLTTDLAAKAPLASPTFTGTVTLPVGLTGVIRADTGVVSTDADVTDIVAAATTTAQGKVELATDGESAANVVVQGNDARMSNARTPTAHVIATNLALGAEHTISGAASGQVLRATAATAANFQALVQGDITNLTSDLAAKAPLASPTFTGTVTLPVGLTGVIRTDTGVVSVDADVTDIVAAATTTALGKVELATDGESAANVVVQGNDARMSNARTPTAHATSHKAGGSDAIKLDELADPTDITTLNATTALHGLLRKLDGLTTTFLRGDGTWAAPTAAAADPVYSPGSFTVVTETGRIQPRTLKLTTTQRATLEGTSRMVLCG